MEKRMKIGLTPKGAYSSETEYEYLDFVTQNNAIYVSLKDANRGHAVTDTTWWQKMTEGAKGESGADGRLKTVRHGTQDNSFELTPNVLHVWGEMSALDLSLAPMEEDGILAEYCFQFSCPAAELTALSLPAEIKWFNGYVPPMEPGKTYCASIIENIIIMGGVA